MEIRIKSLVINNFMILKNFKFIPNGKNAKITGQNMIGKTTISSAYYWLLYGEDAYGDCHCPIKSTYLQIEAEPSVEAIISVDAIETTLKKVYKAKYSKESGEYKESVTECYINGVPKKIREYETYISDNFGSKDKFKILSSTHYFNTQLTWQQRREKLFDLSGTISESQIAESNPSFSELISVIKKYENISEFIKRLKSDIKNTSERINIIPKLISEHASKLMRDSADALLLEKSAIEKEIERLQIEKSQTSDEIKKSNSKAEIANLNSKIIELKNKNEIFKQEQRDKIQEEKNKYQQIYVELLSKLNQCKQNLLLKANEQKSIVEQVDELRTKYKEEKKREWNNGCENICCPTCKRPLEQSQIEDAKKAFNIEKSENLIKISEKGQIATLKSAKLQGEMNELNKEISEIEENANSASDSFDTLNNSEIFDLPEFNIERDKLLVGISNVEEFMESDYKNDAVLDFENKINELKIKLLSLESKILEAKESVNAKTRINELNSELTKLKSIQGENQRKLELSSEFIKFKCSILTDSINDKFNHVKFLLFERNKTNDDIREICEALAFGSADYTRISTAGKVMVGIDIINAFSKHYNLSIPIFIDEISSLDEKRYKELLRTIGNQAQILTIQKSEDEEINVEVF